MRSFGSCRYRPIPMNVRSTIHRFGWTPKPTWSGECGSDDFQHMTLAAGVFSRFIPRRSDGFRSLDRLRIEDAGRLLPHSPNSARSLIAKFTTGRTHGNCSINPAYLVLNLMAEDVSSAACMPMRSPCIWRHLASKSHAFVSIGWIAIAARQSASAADQSSFCIRQNARDSRGRDEDGFNSINRVVTAIVVS